MFLVLFRCYFIKLCGIYFLKRISHLNINRLLFFQFNFHNYFLLYLCLLDFDFNFNFVKFQLIRNAYFQLSTFENLLINNDFDQLNDQ